MHTKDKPFYTFKYDRVFKSIIGNPEDTRLLDCILSDVLDTSVKILSFLPTEAPVLKKGEKVNIMDTLVITDDKELIDVEINTNFTKAVRERNLLYYTSIYAQMAKRNHKPVIKVVQVNLNFDGNPNNPPKEIFQIMNIESKELYTDSFTIINVNIASYKKLWYDKNIKGIKDHIYLVMLGSDKEELTELSKNDKLIREVNNKMIVFNEDGTYTRLISREDDLKMVARNEGFDEGIEQGIEQGVLQGVTSGIEQVTKSMLEKGMKIKDIQEITKLSEKEILKIKNNR